MNTQKNYKDTVYRMLFKETEAALSLYNGLNGTTYTDESMLEFNTLENAIYMGMKNEGSSGAGGRGLRKGECAA